ADPHRPVPGCLQTVALGCVHRPQVRDGAERAAVAVQHRGPRVRLLDRPEPACQLRPHRPANGLPPGGPGPPHRGDVPGHLHTDVPVAGAVARAPPPGHHVVAVHHASAASSLSRRRSSRRSSFPTRDLGIPSTTRTDLGTLYPARCCRTSACNSSSASAAPSAGTTNAVTASTDVGSGPPTAAHSAPPGCASSTSSTSRG